MFPEFPSANRIGPHPQIVIDSLIGTLLGDATFEVRKSAIRVGFQQSIVNDPFFFQITDIWSKHGYCSIPDPEPLIRRSSFTGELVYYRSVKTYYFTSFLRRSPAQLEIYRSLGLAA